jgi:hypothetical protein
MGNVGATADQAWDSEAEDVTPMVDGSLAMALDGLEPLEEEGGDEVDETGRRRRRARARARTISIRRLSKTELNLGRMMYPEEYHLYIDVHPVRGSIKINFPDLEVWEMTDTCALDIADRGGITLEEVGEIMNLTRERVRQVETQGLARLQGLDDVDLLRDYVDE